jgi:Iron-containing redox enzyme
VHAKRDAGHFLGGILVNNILAGENFRAREYFQPIIHRPVAPFALEAEAIERNARIEDHPFFQYAKTRPEVLVLWTSQEAIVTNPFSQILFRVMAEIPNVHVRSLLMPVVYGEHSPLRVGIANNSHPWLIWNLCKSIGLSEDKIKVTKAVANFIHALKLTETEPMRALGALGVGNEQMLIAEYKAIEACFDSALPSADYRNFLQANIGEDEAHTRLIAEAATALEQLGYDPNQYMRGATEGVSARIGYYDTLLDEAKRAC